MYFNRNYFIYFMLIMCSITLCACSPKQPTDKSVLKINDYLLTESEFNELCKEMNISKEASSAREALVENIINRKLLLQEAERMGLDRDKDFLKSIERFWEQSLLKAIIDIKTKDLYGGIKVGDDEIVSCYEAWSTSHPGESQTLDEMQDDIRAEILKEKKENAFNAWLNQIKSRSCVTVDRQGLGLE